MKTASLFITTIIILAFSSSAFAATDGIYQLTETAVTWDGTSASRLQTPSSDYDYTYGDEASLSFTLPWAFNFYGQPYSQISADTNGNIWFSATNPAHSFDLATTGRGPVISAWNNDLSSYYYGGVFIQHKTNPERVVVEWQTETHDDQGFHLFNNFEAVIFPNGIIRVDYKTCNPSAASDYGSGISKDDGNHFISATSAYGNIPTLAGRSFYFSTSSSDNLLTAATTGTGSGTVTSNPAGIACNNTCPALFRSGTLVTLTAQSSEYSLFDGWSNGPCSGTGICQFTITADSAVTASFTYDAPHQVKVDGGTATYYPSLQAAYNAAATESSIKLWAVTFTETLTCSRPITITLHGGYDSSYSSIVGDTTLRGSLTVTDGTVVVDRLLLQ